jgi:hypothetical protein
MCYSTQLQHLVLKLSHVTWLSSEPVAEVSEQFNLSVWTLMVSLCFLTDLVFEVLQDRYKADSVLSRCNKHVLCFGIPV